MTLGHALSCHFGPWIPAEFLFPFKPPPKNNLKELYQSGASKARFLMYDDVFHSSRNVAPMQSDFFFGTQQLATYCIRIQAEVTSKA